jgi:predicted thioesterase
MRLAGHPGNDRRPGGSGLVEGFSTPMLVALMESAAVEALADALADSSTSVGTRIEVSHLAATPTGMTVRARAVLTAVDGRRLTFQIEAWDDLDRIGEAVHERAIVDRQRFDSRIADKRRAAGLAQE